MRQIDWKKSLPLALLLVLLTGLILCPLITVFAKAVIVDGRLDLYQAWQTIASSENVQTVCNSLLLGVCVVLCSTVIAVPTAYLLARTQLKKHSWLDIIFMIPFMTPPYIASMGWILFMQKKGLFQQLFPATGSWSEGFFCFGGLVLVMSLHVFPFLMTMLKNAMLNIPASLEESGAVFGAGFGMRLRKIFAPLLTGNYAIGALLVFVAAMSCYGIPSIIGAPGKVHTVTTRIIEYNGLGAQGISDATGLAVFLMALAILILYLSDFVVARKQYITVSGKSTRPNIVDLGKWRVPLAVLVSLFATIVVLIPFATILTTSFKIDVGKSLFDPENFTLTQWQTIFSRSETMSCLKNSLIFGVITATVGIVVACTMSYLLQRTRIRGRKLPDFLITLGSGTPSVVIALGLIMTMKGDFGVNIYNTAYIMIVAYLIKYLMMGMRTVVSAMSQIHVSLEECSQISGASWTRTMLKITGPLIFPSIAAGWFLIFIPSFYELSMTTLLYSNSTKTIGFQLYEYWTFTSQPQSCAMAFGILMIVVVLNFLLNKLTKGEFSI